MMLMRGRWPWPFKKKQLDILICIIPKINPDAPTVGPAILKSHLNAAGFSCEVIDLNIKLYNYLKAKNGTHHKYYFEEDALFKADFYELQEDFKSFYHEHEDIFRAWVDTIKLKNPRYVGFSLLTAYSQSVAIKLSELVKRHAPEIKIIWGGAQIDKFIKYAVDKNLLDHYIKGDGELSLVEFMKGNLSYQGINSIEPNQVPNLDMVMTPNYDDINWDEYVPDEFSNSVYITGSRGCVRRCTFCNVGQIWPKFRYRSAQNIICEIKMLKQKYNRDTFKFTDSLINGSIRSYRELLNGLIEYKKENPNFSWISQWIIRPKEFSPEEDFRLLKESGCVWLEIGIESFSQEVRYHMGKKFTDEDIDWCLSMLQKYKIASSILMIVGYPTETKEDHLHTLSTVTRLYEQGYMANKDERNHSLLHLCFTSTLMINEETPLWNLVKDEITDHTSAIHWTYKDNTLAERVKRFNELNELVLKYKENPLSWQIQRTMREQNQATLINHNINQRLL